MKNTQKQIQERRQTICHEATSFLLAEAKKGDFVSNPMIRLYACQYQTGEYCIGTLSFYPQKDKTSDPRNYDYSQRILLTNTSSEAEAAHLAQDSLYVASLCGCNYPIDKSIWELKIAGSKPLSEHLRWSMSKSCEIQTELNGHRRGLDALLREVEYRGKSK